MSLFWKIFLWFLLAVTLIVGVSLAVSFSTQSEPFAERWKGIITNTLTVYTETAKQIYDSEGEKGVDKFLQTIKNASNYRDVCITNDKNKPCFTDENGQHSLATIQNAFNDNEIAFEFLSTEENYSAKRFTTAKGEVFVFVLRIEFPRPPIPFGIDWKTRAIRLSVILLTAALLCYALARYLTFPIIKLGNATKHFADGDLQARTGIKRRDEIGQLAKDFDEMAEQIESLITSQTRLTRDISHELRSPLARLNVALELAKNTPNNEAFLNRIETESNRLNEMISNILMLSKLESKSETIDKREVNFAKLFENVVADAKFEAAAKGKSVEILQKDDCNVVGNERLLRSAVENVLRNALRYTKDKVEISLQTKQNKAFITIRDYGDGIPEAELNEIFQPFYRVGESRTRKSGGIGLGLAIAEQSVHAHKGEISARNTEPGLIVEIMLPCGRSRTT
jgi:signal transduction histidine kinase